MALGQRGLSDAVAPMADPVYREARVAELTRQADEARERARQWAAQQGLPMRFEQNGRVFLLVDYTDDGGPVYRATRNLNAGISTAANLVRAVPYGLTGTNLLAGIWDGGNVRATHTEFNGRVVNSNSASLSDHATHVAGTMIARGASSSAIGMATQARLEAYDFDNDLAEMTARAMATPGESNKLQISNHSYGYIAGWETGTWSGNSGVHWFGTWGNRESDWFGEYSEEDRDRDKLLYDFPYYLPFVSAGNDRNDTAPSSGTTFYYWNNGWRSKAYDPATDPYNDGWWLGGHDTIPFGSTAKNLMLVGAVNDAVTNGFRDISKATMTAFSAWGPTDDGRIKPDIVANGASLTSSTSGGDTSYGISSGTSMSSPNASGSAILILQRFAQLFPGQVMRASTLKALILHTADDLHTPGPDYRTGWGLMNTKAAVDHLELFAVATNTPRVVETFISTTTTMVQVQSYWDGDNPIKATLVWTDPPGIARSGLNNTNLALRNNLDLRVITPSGTTNFPWILDPFNPTNAATTGNNFRDNVEQVYIANPADAGLYTFRITYAGSLSNNMQHFSLMISGIDDPADPVDLIRLEGDLDFGAVEIGMVERRILTVHNDNDSAVNVTNLALPGGYSAAWTGEVAALGLRDVPVAFSPVAAGTYDGTLLLWLSQSSNAASRPISGAGVNEFALSITNPPGDISVSNAVATYDLSGTAGAAMAGHLTWTNVATLTGGTVPAQTNWQVVDVALESGTNTLTLSGTNQPSGGILASDAATQAAYSAGWATGDNGGSGFNGWLLSTTGANAGHFIADSTANTNLDVAAKAWGLWANSGDQANAWRPLGRPLQSGDTVQLAFENHWVETGSSVGISLLNPEGQYLFEFVFTGGNANYTLNDSLSARDTGIGFTEYGLQLHFMLTSSNTYRLIGGGRTNTGTLASRADMEITRFRAWNHSAGSGAHYNFYFTDLQITNAPGPSTTTSATVRIVRLGVPPTVDPIPPQTVAVGQTLTYTVTASNPENDPMTFSCTSDVPSSRWSLDPDTGDFEFIPESADLGVVSFDFTATDKDGDSAPVTMEVSVEAPPEFLPLGAQSAVTGVATSFTVSATGHPAPALALEQTTASGGYQFTPATGVLEYTPPYADAGPRSFTFTASNPLGVDTQAVSVTVSLSPPVMPELWVAQTNASDVLAEWTSAGATGYVFDAHTDASFLNLIPGSDGLEDFSNIGASSSSYETRIWTNNGIVWTGYLARTDLTIDGPAIGLQNSAGYFVSQPISGGVDELSIAHRRNAGPPTTFDLFVNSTRVATNISMGTSVATTTVSGISVAGDFVITVTNNGNNVAIFDNLSWTNPPVPGGDFVPGYSNRPVEATSLSVTGLTAGTSYYLRVQALNEAGASDWSNVAEAVPAAINVIDFPPLADQVATNLLGLIATASSGLPVSFAVESGPAILSEGTNLSFTATGSVAIVASQGGDETWPPAADVTNRFEVFKATPAVTVWPVPAHPIAFGQTVGEAGLNTNDAASSVPGAYAYADPDEEPEVPGLVEVDLIFTPEDDARYHKLTGIGVATVVVEKAQAQVTLGGLSQTYDGTPRIVTATTDPPDLTVGLTYDGAGTAPIDAGVYTVSGTVVDVYYQGIATGTLTVAQAAASVTLDALARVYDNSPKSALVTTVPGSLAVDVTYDGAPLAPSAVGVYAVTAAVAEVNYTGSAIGWLTIASPTNLYRDWLAEEWGLNPDDFDPEADDDNDGMTNWQEFLADTDPTDPEDALVLEATEVETGVIRFTFPASSNRFYQLVVSTNLLDERMETNLGRGEPPLMTYSNANPGFWYGSIRVLLEDPDWP